MEGLIHSKPLSLYIHVPFCASKCDYCAFYSLPFSRIKERELDLYMDRILSEIDAINKEWNKPYYTIFIGGGNPGILGYDRLLKILMKASEKGLAEEVTIEVNPENVSEEIVKLKPFLTRVSIGIQSMNPESLRTLGRNGNRERNIKALELLSKTGLEFNVDIMTGIPGTTYHDTLKDIDEIVSYSPDHISFYCLTFEEGTPLINRAEPIGEELEIEHLERGWQRLRSYGYEHYEISNFARNRRYSKHNMVYWHLGQYIGLGPTAESSVGYTKAISMRNTEDFYDYIRDPAFECYRLTKDETEEEYLLTALRIKLGIDKNEYKDRFGYDFDNRYSDAITSLDEDSYISTESRFSLTEKGMLKLDSIILALAMNI